MRNDFMRTSTDHILKLNKFKEIGVVFISFGIVLLLFSSMRFDVA